MEYCLSTKMGIIGGMIYNRYRESRNSGEDFTTNLINDIDLTVIDMLSKIRHKFS